MKIIEKKLTTISHVREILLKREKEAIDGEPMTDEQKKLLNYIGKFSTLSAKDAEDLQKKVIGFKFGTFYISNCKNCRYTSKKC